MLSRCTFCHPRFSLIVIVINYNHILAIWKYFCTNTWCPPTEKPLTLFWRYLGLKNSAKKLAHITVASVLNSSPSSSFITTSYFLSLNILFIILRADFEALLLLDSFHCNSEMAFGPVGLPRCFITKKSWLIDDRQFEFFAHQIFAHMPKIFIQVLFSRGLRISIMNLWCTYSLYRTIKLL